jgi:TLD
VSLAYPTSGQKSCYSSDSVVVGNCCSCSVKKRFLLRHVVVVPPAVRLYKRGWSLSTMPTSTTQLSMTMMIDPMSLVNHIVSSEDFVGTWTTPVLVAAFSVTAAIATTITPYRLIHPNVLNLIVAGTYLERQKHPLRRVYKASQDGWSAIAFHEAVDGLGSGIVVARSITGATFGGYNPNGWRSTDDYYTSSTAFLWCYRKATGGGGSSSSRVVKLPILPGGNCAVFDYATSGPCFGAADLVIGPPQSAVMGGFAGPDAEDISKSAGSLRRCKSAVGSTFDYHPAWPVRGSTQLVDVEVYCADTK